MTETAQEVLTRLAAQRGVSLAALSVMLGRNVAYLQQFVGRGSPRRLAERDRHMLAAFLGVDERLLGAPAEARPALVEVPYLAVAAAAGAGADAGGERVVRIERFAPETLTAAGIAPGMASIIDARGDSMAPTILPGDRLVVDRADRRVTGGAAICVVRRDDDLLVKRVTRTPDGWALRSDNPAWPALTCAVGEIAVIGRVKLLLRVP